MAHASAAYRERLRAGVAPRARVIEQGSTAPDDAASTITAAPVCVVCGLPVDPERGGGPGSAAKARSAMLKEVRERNERMDRGTEAPDRICHAPEGRGTALELHQIERTHEALRIRDGVAESRLASSILEEGQSTPVLVVTRDDGRYVLIDGYRRVRVLTRLGRDIAYSVVLPMSEPAAMVFAHRLASGRRCTALEEAWLLRELRDAHGRTGAELAREFGRTASWVSRRLALLTALPESVQQHVQSGAIGPHAAMTYLVPLSRDNAEDARRLADAAAKAKLTTRQIEKLVLAWRLGDAEQRERLIADPVLYLRAHDVLDAKPEPDKTPPERLVETFSAISALCWRARKHWDDAVRVEPSTPHFELVYDGWQNVRVAFAALGRRIEEGSDAGSRHAFGDSAPRN